MKKTIALFGLAALLLIGAILAGLGRLPQPRPHAPPPTPTPPSPPVTVVPPGVSTLAIGDLVHLRGSLSNGYVRAGSPGELFLQLDLTADDVPGVKRQPLAVALVIDRSGSMMGEKIERARAAAKALVARLGEDDRIAIVSYASDYQVDMPLTQLGRIERARVDRVIDGILDGGGTNISGGMEAGLKELRNGGLEGVISRLILLSDGNANQGETDPAVLAQISENARRHGVTVSTIGIGIDFNEDLMTQVAVGGGGRYYYARDAASIATTLDSELSALEKIAARAVTVELELASGVAVHDVYGYRPERFGSRMVITIGDMTSGARRRAVVRLGVGSASEGALAISAIRLAYRDASSGAASAFDGALSVVATTDMALLAGGERRDVVEVAETVLAAEARDQAARELERGDRSSAIRRLNEQLRRTRSKASLLGSSLLQKNVAEMEDSVRSAGSVNTGSDEGRDFVKSEKLRSYETFAY